MEGRTGEDDWSSSVEFPTVMTDTLHNDHSSTADDFVTYPSYLEATGHHRGQALLLALRGVIQALHVYI